MSMMDESVMRDIEALISTMSTFPGFGFSPSDVELIDYYLKKKLQGYNDYIVIIPELEINKFEPWDLPGRAVLQSSREWFYFNPRGKKYPRGSQNYTRRTEQGYWKPTGTERPVRAMGASSDIIGQKRTLVFHTGRAPKGVRTVWVMHELSMAGQPRDSMSVCRLLKNTSTRKDPTPAFMPRWKIDDLTYYDNSMPIFQPQPQNTSTTNIITTDSAVQTMLFADQNPDKSIKVVTENEGNPVDHEFLMNQFAVDHQFLQLPSYPINSFPLGTCPLLEMNEFEEIPMEISFQRSLEDALKYRYISDHDQWHYEAGPSGYNPYLEYDQPTLPQLDQHQPTLPPLDQHQPITGTGEEEEDDQEE